MAGNRNSKLEPYSKAIMLARVDGRTREGHVVARMRRELFEHLGGEENLSATQKALVERAALLQLRCAKLDEKLLGGEFTEHDSRTYLAWVNSLRHCLTALGMRPAAELGDV